MGTDNGFHSEVMRTMIPGWFQEPRKGLILFSELPGRRRRSEGALLLAYGAPLCSIWRRCGKEVSHCQSSEHPPGVYIIYTLYT